MAEIAAAYVQIIPSMRGVRSTIKKEIGASGVGEEAGRQMGEGMGKGASSRLSRLGNVAKSAFGTVAKVGAVAIGTIGAGLGALAVKGGFERALSIDAARGKLRGLGMDTKTVAAVMKNASNAVEGTAFSLDQAATVATMFGKSGAEAGFNIENVLKSVANVAAASGRSMTDIGAIFSSVKARGKLMGDDLLQLTSSGVEATAILAEHLGKTQSQVTEMVSKGQIDFQTFSEAMRKGLGTTAVEAGNTFAGSLANVKTAIKKVGAIFAQPIVDNMTPVFKALKPLIQEVSNRLQPLADAFGQKFAAGAQAAANSLNRLTDSFKKLKPPSGLSGISGIFTSLIPAVGGLGGMLGGLLGRLPLIGSAFTGLTGPVGLAIGLFVSVFKESSAFRDSLGGLAQSLFGVFKQFTPVIGGILQAISPLFKAIGDALAPVIGAIAQCMGQLANAIQPLIAPIMQIVNVVMGALMPLMQPITTLMSTIAGLMTQIFTAITPLLPVIGQLIMALMPIISAVISVVAYVANVVLTKLNGALQAIIPIIVAVVSKISEFVSYLVGGLASTVSTVVGAVKSYFTALWTATKAVWNGIYNAVSSAVSAVRNAVSSAFKWVTSTISGAWNTVKSYTSSAWSYMYNSVSSGVSRVVSYVKGLPGRILSGLGNLGSYLYNSGSSLLTGFLNGIKAGFNRAKGAVKDGLSAIRSYFPFSPAKRGPFSGRGWVSYSGATVFPAFAEGMMSNLDIGAQAANAFMDKTRQAMSQKLAARIGINGSADLTAIGQDPNITNASATAYTSPAGLSITGLLEIGGDGLARIIDGRILTANQLQAKRLGAMRI